MAACSVSAPRQSGEGLPLCRLFASAPLHADFHEVFQHAIQSAEHRDFVDLPGDFLQRLQLFQAQRDRPVQPLPATSP
jgi:hypothetical protein